MWWNVWFFKDIVLEYYDVCFYVDFEKLEFFGSVVILVNVLFLIENVLVYVNKMNIMFVFVEKVLGGG